MIEQDNQQSIDGAVTRKLGMQQNADNQRDQSLRVHGQNVSLSLIVFILAVIVIIFLIFFFQILFPTNKNLQSLLPAIGASLVASLLSTLLYAFIVEDARRRSEKAARADEVANLHRVNAEIVIEATKALSNQIEQNIKRMLEGEATRLVSAWPELLPKDYFPPLNESSPHFRDQLGKAVARSEQYIFRGGTARFVPSLLRQHARDNIPCNILIIDPRAEPAIRTYALNRYIEPDTSRTLEDIQRDVQEEIYQAIVQLFELRRRFQIEVRMCYDNLFYRSEIVDDGAFVSFYVGDRRTLYPPTYFYTKTNGYFYYSAFHRDFQQSWGLAVETFPMRAEMTLSDLENFLFKIGAGDKSTLSGKITEWRDRQV